MDAKAKREIDEINSSVRDIHKCLFLLDGCAGTDARLGAVQDCRQALTLLEAGEIYAMLKSFEGCHEKD